jgi:hypothetical protein
MKTAAALFLTCCLVAFGEDAPTMMTKLTVKIESPEIPKESFAAQAKLMYRVASRYCRIDENPDLEHGIHGLLIINEPNSWMVNRLDRTARHIVDPGRTYNCRMPMFVNDPKSAEDLKGPMMQLEFGRELEFFRPRSAAPNPGPSLQGKPTMAYTVPAGDSQLFLFTSGDPEVPVAVVRKTDKTREIFWYGEYAQVPFDAKLFAKPEGVKITDVKP